MSITLENFRERSGVTVFRDTAPDSDPRGPRLWIELAAHEPVSGARKGDHFSDVVLGTQVSRVEAYQRYWRTTGMSPRPLEADILPPGSGPIGVGRDEAVGPRGTRPAAAFIAGVVASVISFALNGRRSAQT